MQHHSRAISLLQTTIIFSPLIACAHLTEPAYIPLLDSQPNFLVPGARASHPQIHVSQPTIHHPHFTSPSIAQPMQAAQALFCHIQHQVQVEAVQQRMASAGALSSRALMVSRFANAPAYAAQMATRVSTASSGVISQSAMQQAIHLQRLGNSNLVLDSFLANRTADMLLAHQIRLAAGLPLDPIGQSLLAHFGNQLSSTALLTDSASLSALGQCHAYAESSPTSAVLSSHPVVSSAGNRRFLLYMPSDNDMLAENQIAIRRNLELFEATQADVDTSVAGRRKPLVVGQVGIQCVHCSQVPIKHRKKGARYYPAKLDGIYQAAQNMAYCHLTQSCDHIDYIAKSKLLSFQKSRSNGHGGKTYWSQTARAQGVSETERLGLKFH